MGSLGSKDATTLVGLSVQNLESPVKAWLHPNPYTLVFWELKSIIN